MSGGKKKTIELKNFFLFFSKDKIQSVSFANNPIYRLHLFTNRTSKINLIKSLNKCTNACVLTQQRASLLVTIRTRV